MVLAESANASGWVSAVSSIAVLLAALGGTWLGGFLQLRRERAAREGDREDRRADRDEQDLRDLQDAVGAVLSAANVIAEMRLANPAGSIPTASLNEAMVTMLAVRAGATRVKDDTLEKQTDKFGVMVANICDPLKQDIGTITRALGGNARDIVLRAGELLRVVTE
jgi:hypothetical protein